MVWVIHGKISKGSCEWLRFRKLILLSWDSVNYQSLRSNEVDLTPDYALESCGKLYRYSTISIPDHDLWISGCGIWASVILESPSDSSVQPGLRTTRLRYFLILLLSLIHFFPTVSGSFWFVCNHPTSVHLAHVGRKHFRTELAGVYYLSSYILLPSSPSYTLHPPWILASLPLRNFS